MRVSGFWKVLLPLALVAAPAFGQLTQISQPTTTYTSTTTLVPITVADGTVVTSITNGAETIGLGSIAPNTSFFTARSIPSGGWTSWGSPPNTESSTPRVVGEDIQVTSLTLTLSAPVTTFGFEIEPDSFVSSTINAAYYSGGTLLGTISQSINGHAGALLVAGSSTLPITSVVITAPAGASGFAMAQFRYAGLVSGAVPTLNTASIVGLGLLLAAAGALLAQAQKRPGAARPY